jgi:hypothetical protein
MAVAFDAAVVEELAGFSISVLPTGWLPVNWANIFLALVFGTSSDGE